MKPNLTYRNLFWRMLFLYFLFIAYQIIRSDYLFTDEAFMLWHQADHHTVFTLFHTEGRALTGWLEQWLFEISGTVANLKYIRLLSLGECVLTVVVLFFMLRRWQKGGLAISDALIYGVVGFVAASLSTTICIGWAVCTEIFIPTLLSLAVGWILYEAVGVSTEGPTKEGAPVTISTLTTVGVIVLGVTALFFYQSPYPFLLLPFYCWFLTRKDGKLSKPVIIGLVYYFIILLIYFGLFKYWLKVSGVVAADRTALTFKPLDRLSFFFSFPLNQAFNGNALFDTRSVLSQAVFPVLFLAWAVLTFYRSRRGRGVDSVQAIDQARAADRAQRPKTGGLVRYLLGMLAFWILGYLPLLIAQESFGPYRTMLVLSVMVFLMLADAVLPLISSLRVRMIGVFTLIGAMLVVGAYHYKVYLAEPLAKEYQALRTVVRDGYTGNTREVVFIRAGDHGFQTSLGIDSYKDEFGMPSTNKDWTPEPLLKQLVFELTGSRQQAEALKVTQYASMEEWKAGRVPPELWSDSAVLHRDSILYINAPKLLNDLK